MERAQRPQTRSVASGEHGLGVLVLVPSPERGEFAIRALGSGTCHQAQRWQGLAMKATMVLLLHLLSRLATLLGFGGTTACVGQL